MGTDRVPPTLLQSEPEVTSPVHALGEKSGTIQPDLSSASHRNVLQTTARIDAGNLGPSAALSSTSSERFNDTSSLQPLRSNNDHLAQPIQQLSVGLLELTSGRKENQNDQ